MEEFVTPNCFLATSFLSTFPVALTLTPIEVHRDALGDFVKRDSAVISDTLTYGKQT